MNPEAYEAFLRGMFHLNQYTQEGFEKGLACLRQTVEADPAEALGFAGLALGTSIAGHGLAFGVVPPREAYLPAKSAAVRALELDDTLAEAHAALALVYLYYDWDWAGAEEAFRRALSLNANIPEAHRHFAWYHVLVEFPHLDVAVASMKRARDVAPLTPIYAAELGWMHWLSGQFEEAITEARKSLELSADFPVGLYVLGAVHALRGEFDEAIAAHQGMVPRTQPGSGGSRRPTRWRAGRIRRGRCSLRSLG